MGRGEANTVLHLNSRFWAVFFLFGWIVTRKFVKIALRECQLKNFYRLGSKLPLNLKY